MSPAAEVQEGTATTLSCDVPGREGQDLSYTWYKNSAWLGEGTAHTLLFPHAAPADAGYYSCKVTNQWGSDTSQAISLSVTCECQGTGGSPPDEGPCGLGAVQIPPKSKPSLCPKRLGAS